MSIDWNTAPEGATHWEPRGIVFGEGWMKKVGNEWSYWLEGSGVWADCFVSAEREATFEARPQEPWSGQGLPPVGTVCEACWNSPDEYYQIMVLAQWDGKAIYRWLAGPGVGGLCESFAGILGEHSGPHPKFRPIRTPEQIAAEAREAAIVAMLDLDPPHENGLGLTSRRQFCETLYDAGYRRQESST
ncbi:hypothetical protein ACT517_17240 [Pseudomonas aeruginosa]